MVVEDGSNPLNPLVDTGNVTVNAFNAIKNREKADVKLTLGKDDTTTWNSPNFKVKVKAYTYVDKKTHTYFHSLSIDVNVEDFMGTAELKCPYDSDLMEYWEPIRQTVVIYGANRGDYKILFIGRVRGVKQDGYELVIEFQNYAWKFKQLVTQSYANDNVLNKDGYTIMRLMFEALKIDSYVISESAKNRLKQVGINQDGNVTLNGKELEKMPDLLKRLQKSDPSKLVSKDTLNDKLREKYLHNIKDINYTLKYEKPTKVMQKIASQGNYSAGSNVYENAYGSASGAASGGAGASSNSNGSNTSCTAPETKTMCPAVPSSLWTSMQEIWLYNRSCRDNCASAYNNIVNFATNYPNTYLSSVDSCLVTLSKYTNRKDGGNGGTLVRNKAYGTAHNAQNQRFESQVKGATNYVQKEVNKFTSNPIGYLAGAAKNTLNFFGIRW